MASITQQFSRRHRAYYGGDTPRKITRGVPNGRCLNQSQDGNYIKYLHPGNGPQRRMIKESWWLAPRIAARKENPALMKGV